jgi:hypothetical protein
MRRTFAARAHAHRRKGASMMDDMTVIRRNTTVEYRGLGEEGGGVLLHVGTGAYHGLNEVGAVVWGLLEAADDGTTFGSILQDLRARLDDAPADLSGDIAEFLEDLAARDLVQLGSSA